MDSQSSHSGPSTESGQRPEESGGCTTSADREHERGSHGLTPEEIGTFSSRPDHSQQAAVTARARSAATWPLGVAKAARPVPTAWPARAIPTGTITTNRRANRGPRRARTLPTGRGVCVAAAVSGQSGEQIVLHPGAGSMQHLEGRTHQHARRVAQFDRDDPQRGGGGSAESPQALSALLQARPRSPGADRPRLEESLGKREAARTTQHAGPRRAGGGQASWSWFSCRFRSWAARAGAPRPTTAVVIVATSSEPKSNHVIEPAPTRCTAGRWGPVIGDGVGAAVPARMGRAGRG